MDIETALMLIRPLAEGVDPISGEELPVESTVQHPRLARALMMAVAALEHEQARRSAQRRPSSETGAPSGP